MKLKSKKLSLHRETIRKLTGRELDEVGGGAPTSVVAASGGTNVVCCDTQGVGCPTQAGCPTQKVDNPCSGQQCFQPVNPIKPQPIGTLNPIGTLQLW
jgi:hypothetical protein